MKEHLDLTLAEAVDRLQGNFAADIADHERVHLAIRTMAGYVEQRDHRPVPREVRRLRGMIT